MNSITKKESEQQAQPVANSMQMFIMTLLVVSLMFFVISWVVRSSFNNVMPHLTKSSMKLPKISTYQAFSLIVLISVLWKPSVVVM